MALLRELPNELFVMIVRFLVARRIEHFDPVAIKDLQSLRLVAQKVRQLGSFSLLDSPLSWNHEFDKCVLIV